MKGCFYKIGSDDSLASVNLTSVDLEKKIQSIFENNLEALLGIKFLATEHTLDSGDRIDTLGIDSNNRPVIIEYKKENKRYVLSQVRNYAKSLTERKFVILVTRKIDDRAAENVDTQNKRMICIAKEFTSHDIKMAEDDGIELIEYGILENNILVLEQVVGEGRPKHIKVGIPLVEQPAPAPIQLAQKPTAVEMPTRQRPPQRSTRDFAAAKRQEALETFVNKISKGKTLHQDERSNFYISGDEKIATVVMYSKKYQDKYRWYWLTYGHKQKEKLERILKRGGEPYLTLYLHTAGIYVIPYKFARDHITSPSPRGCHVVLYQDSYGLRLKNRQDGALINQYKIAEAP